MTFTKAHPNKQAAVRALFTVSTRRGGIQLLSNPGKVIRSDWNWYASFRSFTLTVVKLDKE
jgi:hypothetical protein